jgi:hypothetical protein
MAATPAERAALPEKVNQRPAGRLKNRGRHREPPRVFSSVRISSSSSGVAFFDANACKHELGGRPVEGAFDEVHHQLALRLIFGIAPRRRCACEPTRRE